MDVDEIVRRFLEFSPETGVVTFKEDVGRFGRVKKGAVAGCLDVHGYLQVNIKGRVLKVHRVAWFLHTGSWPIGQIDHVNHIRTDNRIFNLRVVDNAENHKNRPRQINNTSGVVGVTFVDRVKKYRVYITVGGRQKAIGYFDRLEDARKAREAANKTFGYHQNHGAESAIGEKTIWVAGSQFAEW